MAHLSYTAALLVACILVVADCRPLTGRRMHEDSKPEAPKRYGNDSIWKIAPKSTTNGDWINLVDLKDAIKEFKLADASTDGEGAANAAAAFATNENPFLDVNNPTAALPQSSDAAAATVAVAETATPTPTPEPTPTPTPTPEAIPSPTPPPALPTTGGNCPDPQAALDLANAVRAKHGAGPLTWNPDLASGAQAWANTCAWGHSPGGIGECLMMGPALSGCTESVAGWAAEAPLYPPGSDFVFEAGHFTQLVWKSTSQMGCGFANCGGGNWAVCWFNAPGNVIGHFAENVS